MIKIKKIIKIKTKNRCQTFKNSKNQIIIKDIPKELFKLIKAQLVPKKNNPNKISLGKVVLMRFRNPIQTKKFKKE